MKRNKGMQLGAIFTVMLIVSMAFVPAVSAKAEENTVTTLTPILPSKSEQNKLPLIKVDTRIDKATPHWLLFVGKKEATLKYIDSSNMPDDEMKEMKRGMKDIWKKYPVEQVKIDNNNTLITFSSDNPDIILTPEENAMLEKTSFAVASGMGNLKGANEDVGILFGSGQHNYIAYSASRKKGLSTTVSQKVRDAADDPDFWPVEIPSWRPQFIKDYILLAVHSYGHYYNPSLGYGDAPSKTSIYANLAKDYYQNGNHAAYYNLGYSTHFINDVGNPLHTGREASQILHSDVHFAYEGYVNDNWATGYNFKSNVDNTYSYYYISDPQQATKDLSTYTYEYVDTLYLKIYDNWDSESWKTDSLVKAITQSSITETTKYTVGLVDYVIR